MTSAGTAFVDIRPQVAKGFGKEVERGVGSALGGIAGTAVKAVAGVALAVGAVGTAIAGIAIKGGIDRALNTEAARVQMARMGLAVKDVDYLIGEVDKTFDGTIFTNPEGFKLTSLLYGAGVEMEKVPGVLGSIADAAAHGNVPLDRMGEIFLKVIGGGRVTGETFRQMIAAGIPLAQLADAIGTTETEMRELATAGLFTSEMFLEGMQNVEMFAGAAQAAGTTTAGAFKNIGNQLARLGEIIVSPYIHENGPMVKFFQAIRQALIDLRPQIQTLSDWLAGRLVPALERATDWLGDGGFVGAIERIQGVVGPVVERIGHLWAVFSEGEGVVDGLVGVFASIGQSLGQSGFFESMLGALRSAFEGLVVWLESGGIGMILTTIIDAKVRLLDAALRLFPALIDALMIVLPALLDTIVNVVIPAVVNFIVKSVPKILQAALELFAALVQALGDILPDLIDVLVNDLLPMVLDTLIEMIPDLLVTGLEVFLALVDALVNALPKLIETLVTVVFPRVLSTILTLQPQVIEAGTTAFLGLVTGLLDALPSIISTITSPEFIGEIIQTLIDQGPELLIAMGTAAVQIGEGLIMAIPEILKSIYGPGGLIHQMVESIIETGVEKMSGAGRDLVGGLIAGIVAKGRDVATAIRNSITDKLPGWMQSALKSGSPSRLMIPFGESISQGVAVGIADGADDVNKAVSQLANNVPRALSTDLTVGATADDVRGGGINLGGVTLQGHPDDVIDRFVDRLDLELRLAT